jgi:hypothetical protein
MDINISDLLWNDYDRFVEKEYQKFVRKQIRLCCCVFRSRTWLWKRRRMMGLRRPDEYYQNLREELR